MFPRVAHLQVLKVGQGLAVAELRPLTTWVKLATSKAHVARRRHQEIHS